jgi:hypothetical protein
MKRKKVASPSEKSKVVTLQVVLEECLRFGLQSALGINDIFQPLAWSLSENVGSASRTSGSYYKLGEQVARMQYWEGGNIYHISLGRGKKWVKIRGLGELYSKIKQRALSQSKPRDKGTFKSDASGMVNKERIRVPHK